MICKRVAARAGSAKLDSDISEKLLYNDTERSSDNGKTNKKDVNRRAIMTHLSSYSMFKPTRDHEKSYRRLAIG